MEPINKHTGVVAPLDRANVDTDAIIPKQFLRKIERTGFGKHLFHELRYTDYEGTKENPQFVLNKSDYRQSTILLARENFGCGSSREHAPWALYDFGFRVIIAPSFADIFYNNCMRNGLLPICLSADQIDELFKSADSGPLTISVDLEQQKVMAEGKKFSFEIDPFHKKCLLKGLDQIDWTLQFKDKIEAYEEKIKKEWPWLV